jgi:glycosyltransferase involved in cell wall biosynthesis
MSITVVIPAHRAERTIRRALDSVLTSPPGGIRVIVVVDGDLDQTAEIVRSYRDKDVSLLVNDANKGAPFSRNRGLEHVTTDYVMFLDADDFIEGPLLEGLAEAMERVRGDVGFGAMQRLEEATGKRGPKVQLRDGAVSDVFRSWLIGERFVGTCSVLWRTDFVRNIGGWDIEIERNQDGELALRAILLGATIARSTKGCGVYVTHSSPSRITQQIGNLPSKAKVLQKLLKIDSTVISNTLKRNAVAVAYYMIARTCYSRGLTELGAEALMKSRDLGFRGHHGPRVHRIVAGAIGLPLRYRVGNFVLRCWRGIAGKAAPIIMRDA